MSDKPNGSGIVMHSALGGITEEGSISSVADADAVEAALPVKLPHMPAPPRKPEQTYCDICGHVGDHARGCDALAKIEAQQQLVELDAAEADEADDPPVIRTMLRQIGATILRRIAEKLETK